MKTIRIISFAAIVLFLVASLSAETVTGRVFLDKNRNLKPDKGEKGVKGVLVSNGREVVQTVSKGNYSLPVEEEMVIFITKPDGYDLPLDEDNLPQFYYIHQPKGSPVKEYRGVEPTGPLPSSIDFPLFEAERKKTFDVVVFADPQPYNHEELRYIRDDVVSELVGTDAEFGITLGDILGNDLSLFERYNRIVSKIGIPFYNVPGNHDMNFDSPDDRHSLETFKRVYGPPYYSFDYGDVHFVLLDDVEWHGKTQKKKGWYKGKISESQLEWLENDLRYVSRDKLIVLCAHIPFKNMRGPTESRLVENMPRLLKILAGREDILLLAGHTHTLKHLQLGSKDGWTGKKPIREIICGTVSGSWWSGPKDARGIPAADMADGTPNGYHIIRFEKSRYVERFKAAAMDPDKQIRISLPAGTISLKDLPQQRIVVNVFNGGSDTRVEARVDDRDPVPLSWEIGRDPFMVNLYNRSKDKKKVKSWKRPRPSSHLFSGPLPGELKPGVHVVTVTAIDPYDRRFGASQLFEVE